MMVLAVSAASSAKSPGAGVFCGAAWVDVGGAGCADGLVPPLCPNAGAPTAKVNTAANTTTGRPERKIAKDIAFSRSSAGPLVLFKARRPIRRDASAFTTAGQLRLAQISAADRTWAD